MDRDQRSRQQKSRGGSFTRPAAKRSLSSRMGYIGSKFRKVNRIYKTFFGKSAEYIIFASVISLRRVKIV